MTIVTLSSKGQLVIPNAIRQAAGMAPGDTLHIEFVDNKIRVRVAAVVEAEGLEAVAGCLARPERHRLTEAQLLNARTKRRLDRDVQRTAPSARQHRRGAPTASAAETEARDSAPQLRHSTRNKPAAIARQKVA